jgi:hypothetical protein
MLKGVRCDPRRMYHREGLFLRLPTAMGLAVRSPPPADNRFEGSTDLLQGAASGLYCCI